MGTARQVAANERVRRAIRPGQGRVRYSPRTGSILPGGPQAPAHLQAPQGCLRSPLFAFQGAARLADEVKVYHQPDANAETAASNVRLRYRKSLVHFSCGRFPRCVFSCSYGMAWRETAHDVSRCGATPTGFFGRTAADRSRFARAETVILRENAGTAQEFAFENIRTPRGTKIPGLRAGQLDPILPHLPGVPGLAARMSPV